MGYSTLAEENQFSFKCPIFNAETRMASCIKLRNLFWRGLRPEKRRGCQACMESGKCPAAQIAQRMALAGHRTPIADEYASDTPVMGKLRRDILERIRSVVVLHSTIMRHGLTSVEAKMIESANDRIDAMLGSAPTGSSATRRATIKGNARVPRELAGSEAASKKTTSRIEQAAASGDLSAAI